MRILYQRRTQYTDRSADDEAFAEESRDQRSDKITNCYYQKEEILAVCDALEKKERKMLLVMAVETGKTRTAIFLVDVLTRHNCLGKRDCFMSCKV